MVTKYIGKFTASQVLSLLALLIAAVFLIATSKLKSSLRPPDLREELQISFSPPVQVALSMGDRYLAANSVTLRLVILDVNKLPKSQYPILAKAHENVAFYNPCQEDNYYVAQAFLPWIGYLPSASKVLSAAGKCRRWDVMPSFFMGFNAYFFEKNYIKAGNWFMDASARVSGMPHDQLVAIASKFYEKQDDPAFALNVLKNLHASANSKQLKGFLAAKIWRQEQIVMLTSGVKQYLAKNGHLPDSFEQLVREHYIASIPVDPLGQGFDIAANGQVVIKRKQ